MKNYLIFIFLVFSNYFIAQQVQLNSTYCNSNLGALGSNFYWTTNGAQQYRVRITLGASTWIYAPGLSSTGFPKTFTNLSFAGVNPQYSSTYSVQVDYMIGGNWQNDWGPSCTVTTPPPSDIQLEPAFCNASLSSLTSIFRAQTLSGGTTWRFRVTNTVTGEVKVVDKGASFGSTTTRRTTSISQLASLPAVSGSITAIGQAIYTVECAVSVQGGPFSGYGPACNITITQSLNPTIVSGDCGVEHNYIFQDFLDAVPPTPSTGVTYQFRLIDQSNSVAIESAVVSVPKVKIYDIPGYAYNKTYSASVRCIRQGITGSYGPSCILNTENTPYTKIQDGQFSTADNCDVTIPTFTQRLYAFAIPGGSYQFEIDNGLATYYHQTNNIRSFRLSEVPGYVQVFNTNHNIRVRVSMDNYATYGPWDASCFAKTPLAIMENPNNDFISNNQGEFLQITVFPNPSSKSYNLRFVDEDLFETLNAKLYDCNGRLLFEQNLNKNEVQNFSFGSDLSTGLYQLILQDNEGRIENFRLIKSE
jgi:hypothetical protein